MSCDNTFCTSHTCISCSGCDIQRTLWFCHCCSKIEINVGCGRAYGWGLNPSSTRRRFSASLARIGCKASSLQSLVQLFVQCDRDHSAFDQPDPFELFRRGSCHSLIAQLVLPPGHWNYIHLSRDAPSVLLPRTSSWLYPSSLPQGSESRSILRPV